MTQKPSPDAALPDDLVEIERTAAELARLAGAEIVTALGTSVTVRYKTSTDELSLRDPVSEIDNNVERLIRARLGERFPTHDIIGEEIDERPRPTGEIVWAIDPIDGTTNFVNGFPIFGASIGVLYRGRPIVGAIWSSFTHTLGPGVYHARAGGKLSFDGTPIDVSRNPHVRRRLAGAAIIGHEAAPWDYRKTGSAAVECALVAIGILEVARFASPNIWDVAGGAALVRASGGTVYVREHDKWRGLKAFEPDLATWRYPLIMGRPESVEAMAGA